MTVETKILKPFLLSLFFGFVVFSSVLVIAVFVRPSAAKAQTCNCSNAGDCSTGNCNPDGSCEYWGTPEYCPSQNRTICTPAESCPASCNCGNAGDCSTGNCNPDGSCEFWGTPQWCPSQNKVVCTPAETCPNPNGYPACTNGPGGADCSSCIAQNRECIVTNHACWSPIGETIDYDVTCGAVRSCAPAESWDIVLGTCQACNRCGCGDGHYHVTGCSGTPQGCPAQNPVCDGTHHVSCDAIAPDASCACASNSECGTDNACTTYTCVNPGSSNAYCSNITNSENASCGTSVGTCSSGNPFNVNGRTWSCQAACMGHNAACSVPCASDSDCGSSDACNSVTCNFPGTSSSYCSNTSNQVEGVCGYYVGTCNSGDAANVGSTTWSCNGSCGGASQSCSVACSSASDCTGAGVCTTAQCNNGGSASSYCSYPNKANGTACTSDNNSCTSDVCSSGTCVHNNNPVNGSCGSANGVPSYSTPASNLCSSGSASSVSGSGPFTWTCNNSCSGSNASCSAPLKVNGACGGSVGACSAGTAANIGTTTWNCNGQNGGSNASCSVTCASNSDCSNNNVCTSALCSNGGTSSSFCSNPNLANGTACTSDGNSCTSDVCNGSGVCVHNNNPVSGACGGSVGVCNAGTPANVGKKTWDCVGSCSGTTANCGVKCGDNADCNDANACTTDVCNNPGKGNASCSHTNNPVNGTLSGWSSCSLSCGGGTQTRTCTGASCGGDATCSGAALSQSCNSQPCAVNGVCGPMVGNCTAGTPANVGSTTWNCNGLNGGSNASCSVACASNADCNDGNSCTTDTCSNPGSASSYCSNANSPVNGVCGSANGVATSSAPSSNLCNAGSASAVSGSGPWTWSCNGSCSGSSASCSAPPTAPNPPVGPPRVDNSGTLVGVACDNVKISWTDNSTNETGFKIFKDGGLVYTAPGSAPASATGASMSYSYVPGDSSTHSYTVAATNAGGDSALTAAVNNPVAATSCQSNLGPSTKTITTVNGSAYNSNTTLLKLGDQLVMVITVDNSQGTKAATGITIVDRLTNLKIPSAGLNAVYSGTTTPITLGAGSGHYSIDGSTAEPNQKITFDLSGQAFDVPAGGVKTLSLNFEISVVSSFNGSNSRLQNSAVINYSGGAIPTQSVTTPLVVFSTATGSPIIKEVP